MKYFLTALWAFVCIGVLAFSHITWNKQTSVQALLSEPSPKIEQETIDANNEDESIKLAANWPDGAKEQLLLSLKEGKPFKILFVGSTALQWEKQVTEGLAESFGDGRIVTALHTYDVTSKDFVSENIQAEIASEKAQIVVIEPFLLNDNGNFAIDVTLANVTKIMEEIKAENPDTTFMLQPTHPIYLPKYYSTQVEALKAYAEENHITYLDHWSAWPATDDLEIKNYLNEDQSGPNEKGNQAWAQYLVEYFAKK
jgi:lysophospholipase L1-like esterase